MSLLNSLGLLLAKSTSFARYFLALSFALTAISIAACSKDTAPAQTEKEKCEAQTGKVWDTSQEAGKECQDKKDTTATEKEEAETGTAETETADAKVTFEFTFATAPNDGFTEEAVNLTATLDVDGASNTAKDAVAVEGGFSVTKKGMTLTFTLSEASLKTAAESLTGVTQDTDKAKVELTLTNGSDKAMLKETNLMTFLKGLKDNTSFDTFAGTADTEDEDLADLLTELDKLFASGG